jgi:hypothetical protein
MSCALRLKYTADARKRQEEQEQSARRILAKTGVVHQGEFDFAIQKMYDGYMITNANANPLPGSINSSPATDG